MKRESLVRDLNLFLPVYFSTLIIVTSLNTFLCKCTFIRRWSVAFYLAIKYLSLLYCHESVEMAASERDRERERDEGLGLLSLTLRWGHSYLYHIVIDLYSEPHLVPLLILSRGRWRRLSLLWGLADSSVNLTGSLPYLSVNFLSLYNILNAHLFFFRFLIHEIYFSCPFVYINAHPV